MRQLRRGVACRHPADECASILMRVPERAIRANVPSVAWRGQRPRNVLLEVLPSGMFDTSPEAARIQTQIQRGLLPADRLLIAIDMSETVRELMRARLRREHPEWDERRLAAELLRDLLPAGHPSAP